MQLSKKQLSEERRIVCIAGWYAWNLAATQSGDISEAFASLEEKVVKENSSQRVNSMLSQPLPSCMIAKMLLWQLIC